MSPGRALGWARPNIAADAFKPAAKAQVPHLEHAAPEDRAQSRAARRRARPSQVLHRQGRRCRLLAALLRHYGPA